VGVACRSLKEHLSDEELMDMVNVVTRGVAEGVVATPRTVRQQYGNLFDHATSLPSWPLLIDRTRMALERAARNELRVAVIVFDDVRRRSSDSPDLATCVGALRDSVFADDTVARISGRTFVFVLNDVAREDTLADTAHEIAQGLGISCHIGLAFGALPCDPEELINRARQDALPQPPPPVAGWEDQYRLGAT
jgi:GGDEF domain-containing protein